MKLFKCHNCGQLLYFENTQCGKCGYALGFLAQETDLVTLISVDNQTFNSFINPNTAFKYCANAQYEACNWILPANHADAYCMACKLNHTIPNLSTTDHVSQWKKLEVAKHRLVYTLLRLGLPILSKTDDPTRGLAFDFLADEDASEKVIMGHDNGVITINLSEADEAKRVSTQEKLNEPYRTLLGHFRHESGHYYWDRLVMNDPLNLQSFRNLFGDEQADYGEALKTYYQQGPPAGWADSFVSAYATAHAWEDWAETWAHYLHIMDTIETAYSFGMGVKPVGATKARTLTAEFHDDPFKIKDFQELIDLWFPLTLAVNSLNRSMGQPDFYPFIIAPLVIEKLKFIHNFIFPLRNTMGNVQSVAIASSMAV